MKSDWEDIFASWAQPPSQTEEGRIENAITAIRKALNADDFLASNTKVFVQGSYRNRVNVRQESDIDIGVLYTGESFGVNYPEGKTDNDFKNTNSDYSYLDFKNAISTALIAYFGKSSVTRGSKAFDIHANSYRVDADVVPLFIHRRYSKDGSYICGVQLRADDGSITVNWPERLYDQANWPEQHYENGVAKNTETSRNYKGVVRILKKLRCVMDDACIKEAKPIKGFLVECLVWNVPPSSLNRATWDESVQAALSHLWENTKSINTCNDWGEVSELKYIFRGSPASKLTEAHAFIDNAWSYIGVR